MVRKATVVREPTNLALPCPCCDYKEINCNPETLLKHIKSDHCTTLNKHVSQTYLEECMKHKRVTVCIGMRHGICLICEKGYVDVLKTESELKDFHKSHATCNNRFDEVRELLVPDEKILMAETIAREAYNAKRKTTPTVTKKAVVTNCPHCGYDGAGYASNLKRHIAHCKKHLPPVEIPLSYTCEHCNSFTACRKDSVLRHQRTSCSVLRPKTNASPKSVMPPKIPTNEIVLIPDNDLQRKYDELEHKYDELQRTHNKLEHHNDVLNEEYAEMEKKNEVLEDKVSDAKEEVDVLESQLELIKQYLKRKGDGLLEEVMDYVASY